MEESKVQLELKDDTATIKLPQEVFFMDGIQYAKKAISDEIFKFVKGITRVYFTEVFESPEAQKPKEEEAPKEKKTTKRQARKSTK